MNASKLYNNIIEDLAHNNEVNNIVTDSTGSLSISSLLSIRNKTAVLLKELGIHKGDRIVVQCGKSINTIIVVLACFRIGAIFVPLDAKLPEKRKNHILNALLPSLIVSSDNFLSNKWRSLTISQIIEESGNYSNDVSSIDYPDCEDGAYCIFTSGSTGRPKGALITHKSLGKLCSNLNSVFPIGPSSTFLSLGPLFFDISVVDLLYPLSQGAHVILYDKPFFIQRIILSIIEKLEVTNFCAITALLTLMSDDNDEFVSYNLSSLKQIMTGGEAPNKMLIKKWKDRVDGLSVLNGYGPTEFTCTCIVHDITYDDLESSFDIPIGKPIPEVEYLIYDNSQESNRGELLLSGPQMLNSYWNNHDEYKKCTMSISGKKYYKTGDIVLHNKQGQLVYVGRTNEVVKISGHRVNLGDTRLILEKEFSFNEYSLLVVKDRNSVTHLCLAISDENVDSSITNIIRNKLRLMISDYMIPRMVAKTKKMPKLPGGKINKSKLVHLIEKELNESVADYLEI